MPDTIGIRVVLLLASIALCSFAGDPFFERSVAPILKAKCTQCHNAKQRSGGISLSTYEDIRTDGGLAHPGDPAASRLVQVVGESAKPRMPFGKEPLSKEEVNAISQWITNLKGDSTAHRHWWAFERPVTPEVPAVREKSWVRNEIDRFILASLEAKGLAPSADADVYSVLRRLSFDFLGEPPSPDEVRRFVSDSANPGAYERLVDRLLADRRFGERWGQHWLDVARYADTQGFEADKENYHIWRYRDYVIAAFNQDKPYDRFIIEQLAGDEIVSATPEARIATGFLRLAPRFQTTNAQELRQMTLDELTSTTGSVFLGLCRILINTNEFVYVD